MKRSNILKDNSMRICLIFSSRIRSSLSTRVDVFVSDLSFFIINSRLIWLARSLLNGYYGCNSIVMKDTNSEQQHSSAPASVKRDFLAGTGGTRGEMHICFSKRSRVWTFLRTGKRPRWSANQVSLASKRHFWLSLFGAMTNRFSWQLITVTCCLLTIDSKSACFIRLSLLRIHVRPRWNIRINICIDCFSLDANFMYMTMWN